MRLGPIFAAILLATGIAATEPAFAQQPSAASQQNAQALQQELAGIQQQLAEIEAKAMQDPEIAKEAEQLDAAVQREIEKADPKFDTKIARLEEIVKELESKVQAQAPEGELMPLVAEGQAIQREIQNTQAQVLQAEPLSSRVGKFHDRVQKKMNDIDPNTTKLVERAEAIVQQLQAQGGGQPGA